MSEAIDCRRNDGREFKGVETDMEDCLQPGCRWALKRGVEVKSNRRTTYNIKLLNNKHSKLPDGLKSYTLPVLSGRDPANDPTLFNFRSS